MCSGCSSLIWVHRCRNERAGYTGSSVAIMVEGPHIENQKYSIPTKYMGKGPCKTGEGRMMTTGHPVET